MKINYNLLFLGAVILLIVFSLWKSWQHPQWGCRNALTATDTVVITDTVRNLRPTPVRDTIVRYAVRRVPVHIRDTVTIPYNVQEIPDTHTAHHQPMTDTIEAELPITQRVYSTADYTAYVSGYEPSLDSITLIRRTERIETVRTQPPKCFGLGVTVGYGYTQHGFAPFLGIGLSYSIFSF